MSIMIEIRKYRQTRFWAVYVDGELLAVVVYRKGARAIADLLMQMHGSKAAEDAASIPNRHAIRTYPPQ
jgi:hypothetical protein